jgi:hypothetical protein
MFESREKKLSKAIPEFMHDNKDLLIIIGDPKTDTLYASYKDITVAGKIKTADGKKIRVIKEVLSASTFHERTDQFITGLMEVMQLPIKAGNQFFQFVDGAIYNIAHAIQQRKKPARSATAAKKGNIKSPFVNSK